MWECVLESTGPVTSRYPQCTAAQWESVSLQHNLLVGVPGGEGLAVDVHHGLLSEQTWVKYLPTVLLYPVF